MFFKVIFKFFLFLNSKGVKQTDTLTSIKWYHFQTELKELKNKQNKKKRKLMQPPKKKIKLHFTCDKWHVKQGAVLRGHGDLITPKDTKDFFNNNRY